MPDIGGFGKGLLKGALAATEKAADRVKDAAEAATRKLGSDDAKTPETPPAAADDDGEITQVIRDNTARGADTAHQAAPPEHAPPADRLPGNADFTPQPSGHAGPRPPMPGHPAPGQPPYGGPGQHQPAPGHATGPRPAQGFDGPQGGPAFRPGGPTQHLPGRGPAPAPGGAPQPGGAAFTPNSAPGGPAPQPAGAAFAPNSGPGVPGAAPQPGGAAFAPGGPVPGGAPQPGVPNSGPGSAPVPGSAPQPGGAAFAPAGPAPAPHSAGFGGAPQPGMPAPSPSSGAPVSGPQAGPGGPNAAFADPASGAADEPSLADEPAEKADASEVRELVVMFQQLLARKRPAAGPIEDEWSIGVGDLLADHPKVPKKVRGIVSRLNRFGGLTYSPQEIVFDGDDVPWEKVTEVRTRHIVDYLIGDAVEQQVENLPIPWFPGRKRLVDALGQAVLTVTIATAKNELEKLDLGLRIPAEIAYKASFGRTKELNAGVLSAIVLSDPAVNASVIATAQARGIPVVADEDELLADASERAEKIREKIAALEKELDRFTKRFGRSD